MTSAIRTPKRRATTTSTSSSKRPTVLVVGTSQAAAPASARSLARAGFRAVGVRQPGRLAGRTRYCSPSYLLPGTLGAEDLAAAIDEICSVEEVEVVVPLADETLGALIRHRPDGARWSVMGPRPDVFTALCDKSNLAVTSARAGLDVAAQVTVAPGETISEMPPLPAFVKVVPGLDDNAPAGRPIRVTTERECESAVAELGDSRTVIVQEEILGDRWRFHFARQDSVLVHVGVRTIAEYPPRTGQSSVSVFGPTPPVVAAAGSALLETTGHDGIGSIQLIVRDGRVYCHDANLRLPASVAGTIAAGLDMPRYGVEIARGDRIEQRHVEPRRLRLAQLNGEWPALLDAFEGRTHERGRRRIAAEILLASFLPGRKLEPFDLTDPAPTLAALTAARRRVKSLDALSASRDS